jgi:cob(I)alamin adenosyltransferase
MRIYTRTGDSGETGLLRGPRVAKHHPRVDACGNVDELNALLGVAISEIAHAELNALLTSIQNDLFEVGGDLATPLQEHEEPESRITAAMTARLEEEIDRCEASLPELRQFILPTGSKGSALLHYARTVCRRAERSVTRLGASEPVNPEVIRYLNRLSDLLFVLARAANRADSIPDSHWKNRPHC